MNIFNIYKLCVILLISTTIRVAGTVDPLLKCKCDPSTRGCEKGEDGRWFLPCGATGKVCGWRESTIKSPDGNKVTSSLYRCEIDAENLNTKCLAKTDCSAEHGHHSNSCYPVHECRCETDFCEPSENLDPSLAPGSSKCTPEQECECMKKFNKTCDSESNVADVNRAEPMLDSQTESFVVTTERSHFDMGQNAASNSALFIGLFILSSILAITNFAIE